MFFMHASTDTDSPDRDAAVTRRVGRLRIGTGLAQGALLYWLYHAQQAGAWPASIPMLFLPLVLCGIVLPVLLISSLGHLRRSQLLLWLGTAALVLAGIALHDAWRSAPAAAQLVHPSFLVFPFSAGFFFIAHSLVLAGAQDGRHIAHYATCFDSAWKNFIQLLFSAIFVLGVWLVMWLGDALFDLLKLNFLEQLLQQQWFSVPLVCLAFSSAMHVTDVRPAIVRGIRALLLVLLAWILPVAVLLVGGFLATLPFTGLEVLWQTRRATSVLLAASAVLVVLVNAAYQSGDAAAGLARSVRFAARLACFLLVPLVGLGIYALALRVGDYGWTTERVIAAACLAVALFYAVGYAAAAANTRQGAPSLDWLRHVNVAAAVLVLAVSLALFSPVADPARIAVSDQVARLAGGQVTAAQFDYRFLRFHAARYGTEALQALAASGAGPQAALVREQAAAALRSKYDNPSARSALADVRPNLRVWPRGTALPAGFPMRGWGEQAGAARLPRCLLAAGSVCDAFSLDIDGDGGQEVLLAGVTSGDGAALLAHRDGKWGLAARLPAGIAGCEVLLARFRTGDFELVAPRMREIEVGGQRLVLQPVPPAGQVNCPQPPAGKG